MTHVAVSDTGPLIHLDEIDSLALLSAFDSLLIPETVYEELERGTVPDGMSDLSYEVHAATEGCVASDDLDAGERAAVAVAKEHAGVLLTDDLAARTAASDAAVDVHGSIGVIVLGYSRGLIDSDDAAFRMRALQHETSLFVTEAVVERGIRMLDEE